MLKRYTFWLWLAVVLLLLTALVHSVTLFIQPEAQNETERQLLLLLTVKQDFGAGFHRSMKEIIEALSACFSLLCLLGGLTIMALTRKCTDLRLLKSIVGVHVLVFALCFFMMVTHTFLPPIILTGLVFASLLIAYFLIPREPVAVSAEKQ